MVYTGKPSRACQTCKNRRIKCDEARPICSQCKKSNRACPGYPDEFDLIFRDENKAMRKKARKASGSKSSTESSPSQPSPSSTFGYEFVTDPNSVTLVERTPASSSQSTEEGQLILPSDLDLLRTYEWYAGTVPVSLSPSLEDQATAFFFRNFVLLPQQAESMRGFLELLVPVYNQTTDASALHSATAAVSYAALGRYPGRQDLLKEAFIQYGKALTRVNQALQDPVASKSDDLVLAVLLFSLYEAIMSTNEDISTWGHHVDGAVALIKARGAEQFKDRRSRDIFRAVRTVMITSCVQRSKPVEDFPGGRGWQADEEGEQNAANRLTLLCIDLPNIRHRTLALTNSEKTPYTEKEALDLIEYARMIDLNLENWAYTLPENWHYRTARMVYEEPEDIRTATEWPGPQHVYDDVYIANIVNDYRICRIFCQKVVLGCAAWLSQEEPDDRTFVQRTNARFVIQQMVDEISSSVPFHMSYEMQPIAQSLGQDQAAAEALGGYFLVWALYVAANAETVPQRQREWLQGRLFHIGNDFGLTSAQILALARRHVLTCGPMFP